MRIINLTGEELRLQNKRGEFFHIPPANFQFSLNPNVTIRDWNEYYANQVIETDGIEEPVSIKTISLEFNSLPPKMHNAIYVVDEASQFIIRMFTDRKDFYTVFDNHICCVKKQSHKYKS